MPKVSIIIPCYNQEEFLEKTLQSVENQTFSDWECLLIDDGSIDKTGEIAKSWSEKDSRFKYHKRENQGVTKTRDFGLEQAKGENGFGYDPLFWLPELNVSSAELSKEEKNKISHRGQAMKLFKDSLK